MNRVRRSTALIAATVLAVVAATERRVIRRRGARHAGLDGRARAVPAVLHRRGATAAGPGRLRSGAAIGFNQRIDGVWPQPWNLNDLDRRDRTGWTYSPGTGLTVSTSPTGGTLIAHHQSGTVHLLDGRLVDRSTGSELAPGVRVLAPGAANTRSWEANTRT